MSREIKKAIVEGMKQAIDYYFERLDNRHKEMVPADCQERLKRKDKELEAMNKQTAKWINMALEERKNLMNIRMKMTEGQLRMLDGGQIEILPEGKWRIKDGDPEKP